MNIKAFSTKWRPPYKKNHANNDVCNFQHLRQSKQAGVYLISDKQRNIVYIGYSRERLYTTLYHHFEAWNDKYQERHLFDRNKHEVRIIYTTPARAELLEQYLIYKLDPKANRLKYKLPRTYLIRAEEILQDTEYIKPSDYCPF